MSSAKVIISPLNWGLGHAGRMIPLALELKARGWDVIFGADPELLSMVKNELTGIRLIEIPGVRIRYSRLFPQYLCIFFQIPSLILSSLREHRILKRLAAELNPAVIISDNRFGFYHHKIFSVYITHQLRIPFPSHLRFLEPFAALIHRKIIKMYDLCLVPDYPGSVNLSGRLSHDLTIPDNVYYMGPVSRFMATAHDEKSAVISHPYCCLILSGPEPQRSILLEKVITASVGIQLVIISSTDLTAKIKADPMLSFVINPDTAVMRKIIEDSSLVIARAGYTSVMELASLGKGGLLIPTPGQPEQEYLGKHLNGHYGFITTSQNRLRETGIIAAHPVLKEPPFPVSKDLFDKAMALLPEYNKE